MKTISNYCLSCEAFVNERGRTKDGFSCEVCGNFNDFDLVLKTLAAEVASQSPPRARPLNTLSSGDPAQDVLASVVTALAMHFGVEHLRSLLRDLVEDDITWAALPHLSSSFTADMVTEASLRARDRGLVDLATQAGGAKPPGKDTPS